MRRKAKQERAHDTVAALVEAAAQVLLRRGYARATTNRIAEAAGVSIGTLYQYFRNKDEIFDALIQRETRALTESLPPAALTSNASLEAALGAVLATALRTQRYGPDLYRALDQVPNALFRRRLNEGKRTIVRFVRELLALHRRELRVDDLDLAAFLVVNAAEGIGYNATPELFNERLVAEMTTLFARYLGPGPSQRSGPGP